MKFLKKLGLTNILLLALCAAIICVSEYLFMTGEEGMRQVGSDP